MTIHDKEQIPAGKLLDRGEFNIQKLSIMQLRTRGHVFCCLLALKISREMERRLHAVFGTTDADPHAITPADAITALSRLCLLEYQIDDQTTVTRLPKPDVRQKQILEALQVHLPEK